MLPPAALPAPTLACPGCPKLPSLSTLVLLATLETWLRGLATALLLGLRGLSRLGVQTWLGCSLGAYLHTAHQKHQASVDPRTGRWKEKKRASGPGCRMSSEPDLSRAAVAACHCLVQPHSAAAAQVQNSPTAGAARCHHRKGRLMRMREWPALPPPLRRARPRRLLPLALALPLRRDSGSQETLPKVEYSRSNPCDRPAV